MLLDIRYTDDGFAVDAILVQPEEQALSVGEFARQVWRPDRILWLAPPVIAQLRRHDLPQIPARQKYVVTLAPARPALVKAAMRRLRDSDSAHTAVGALWLRRMHDRIPDIHDWVNAQVRFFESEPARTVQRQTMARVG